MHYKSFDPQQCPRVDDDDGGHESSLGQRAGNANLADVQKYLDGLCSLTDSDNE